MQYDLIVDIMSIVFNLVALMMCLFLYFEHTRRTLTFALIFFLGNLLSNYYWGVYELLMDDYPNVSSGLAYFGWNLAFFMLAVMQFVLRKEQGLRRFNIISFIPVLTNVPQLLIYLQYGGYFNNIWQVLWTTVVEILAIDSIIWYFKRRKKWTRVPYINIVLLVFMIGEYVVWTSSCYEWPYNCPGPYHLFSVLNCLCYVLIPLSIGKQYGYASSNISASRNRLMKIFKPIYVAVVVICCFGGYLLGLWMRDTLNAGIGEQGESDPYSIIAVMLFVVSFIIVSFTVTIILVVSSEKKTYESEELAAAKYLAEKSNAAKSDFLAQMSHEIRTPINAVLGMNEMILRESLQARDDLPKDRDGIRNVFSEICNYSGNIDSAGKNLLSIINDILDFSKIEAGKLEIVDNDYQLSSVLNDVSNMIVFKARNKGLEYDVDVDENLPDVLRGDEVRVRQIVTNLLNNAVKYTESGRVILSVSEKKEDNADDAAKTNLVISVKDTGIGIKEEDREKLFKKFERVDIEKNSSIEGTGLGLAITGSLVGMMGGTISVDSDYGEGSTFTAVIPQQIISDEPIGDFREKFEKSISALKARKEAFKAKDTNILVVDDTPMNHMVVKGLLKNTMINIDTAMSGDESIKLTAKKHYDLIMMDQRMPGMDGITAMHRIREDKDGINFNTPFICLTADAISGAKERYIAEGFNDYLTKPIDSSDLEEMLLEYLPKDKIERVSEPEDEGKDTAKPETSDDIPGGGLIDRATGLDYCEGDEDLYRDILSSFVSESGKKVPAIKSSYDSENWDEYGVYVHSVKSSSLMIGAKSLYEKALGLEMAAKSGDIDTVRSEHGSMMDMYLRVVGELKKSGTLNEEGDESAILEFMPDDEQ